MNTSETPKDQLLKRLEEIEKERRMQLQLIRTMSNNYPLIIQKIKNIY